MNAARHEKMTSAELVNQFEIICLEQSNALRRLQNGRYNFFYDKMVKVRAVLKERNERGLLTAFYGHPDPHVRFQAAMATLALFPEDARKVLRQIADREEWPSDGDARRILRSLQEGTFVPI